MVGAILFLSVVGSPSAQTIDDATWGFNPGAYAQAIARQGNVVYVGGNFNSIGPSSGGGLPVNAITGIPVIRFPKVVGRVLVVLADNLGGWYIGGQFTHVDTLPRANLAHVLGDGTVSEWAPNPDGAVRTIAQQSDTLFVGGDFTHIGGATRGYLAALLENDDTALGWQSDADSRVAAVVVHGSDLFVGGWFSTLAGQPAQYCAAVRMSDGARAGWTVAVDGRVNALAIHDSTAYLGGYFTSVNGESRTCIAAVDVRSGATRPWDAALVRTPLSTLDGGPHVNAILPADSTLFVAGSFSSLGGQTRRGLAQLAVSNAQATPWNPSAKHRRSFGPEFWALARDRDTLYVAGQFDSLAGLPGSNCAALSASSAFRLDWNPRPNDYVFALCVQGANVFIGGWFTSVGNWVRRSGLAAIDASTGRVTDWNPRANDYVRTILIHDNRVFVGGAFDSVGGQQRSYLASLDMSTGQATDWNPGADWDVWSLTSWQGNIVAGGIFSQIGGRARRGLAMLDPLSGEATSWDPRGGGDVYAVAVSESVIYVGGDFLTMGGQSRTSLAALDPVSGNATPWNASCDGIVLGLAQYDGHVYVGGDFHALSGVPRAYLGAVDGAGNVTSWAPDAYGPQGTRVEAMAADQSTIYAGGYFSGVAGQPSEYLAAIDPTSGAPRQFPHPDGQVATVAVSGATVYVGGGFGRVGSLPLIGLAAITTEPTPIGPRPTRIALTQCVPNPVVDKTVIRYVLPTRQQVTVRLMDLQGRTIRRVLDREDQDAGPHEVTVSAGDLPAGCYHYQLTAGPESVSRKMVILR